MCVGQFYQFLYGRETWSLTLKQECQQSAEDQGKPQESLFRVANVLTKILIGHILQTDLKTVATTSACSVSEKRYYALNFVICRLPSVVRMVKYGRLPVRLR